MHLSPIFTTNLPQKEWVSFNALGFDHPVNGILYRGSDPPVCGMPLGGIDTGCLDLEATGVYGYSTIFNSLVPRRGPINEPFLGFSTGNQTWICTMLNLQQRRDKIWFDIYNQRFFNGAQIASEIHYWGHYPVADLEFTFEQCPLQVGLRSWSPFIPGDAGVSNTPGAVFEVHLRNVSSDPHQGILAFSFPGPAEYEAGTTCFERSLLSDGLKGLVVASDRTSYALAVDDDVNVRTGGSLGVDGHAWCVLEHYLPQANHQSGSSLGVEFSLEPGTERIIRFYLAWYSPIWLGGGSPSAGGHAYTHMYASRFESVEAVARFLSHNHEMLLRRILAWQSVIYSEENLPPWLRESLINIFHLIPETTVWGQAKPPIGDWCKPEDGLFGMNESPRWCPQIECIPCGFYGNLPIVYFFPELALSTLRGYKAYQYPGGAAPWVFGGCTVGSPPYELAMPSPGYAHKPQTTLDGACYLDMVDKLWQRTGDDQILVEFYASVKQNTIMTMQMRPGSGPAGIVSMPAGNNAYDWYEMCDLFGIVPHIGGVHLAQLRLTNRMAEAMGDWDFASQCQTWLDQGSEVLEREGWGENQYLLFNELETGKKSDVILAHQLDGEWIARFHGLEGVFRPDRVEQVLIKLERTSIKESAYGAVVFLPPEGAAHTDWDPGYWSLKGVHPPGTFMLAMLYLYTGRIETGLDLARRTVLEVIRRGWLWDWPVVLDGSLGSRVGFDYYQNLILWSLPASINGVDLASPCKPGGLVDRVIQAGLLRQAS